MNLDIFFTAQHQQVNANNGQNSANSIGGSANGGLNFMDMILGKLLEESQKASGDPTPENKDEAHELLSSDNPLLDKDAGLDLVKILADNPEIEQEVADFIESTGLGSLAALEQTLVLNQQAFDNTLKPLTDGIITAEEIAKGSPRLLNALLIEDQKRLNEELSNIEQTLLKIEELKAANDPSLINSNLTPQQLASLEAAEGELAKLNEDLAGILSGFVAFVPATNNKGQQTPAAPQNAASTLDTIQHIAARLNTLNAGGDASDAVPLETPSGDADAEFEALLEKALSKPSNGNGDKTIAANNNTPTPNAAQPQAAVNPAVLNFQNMPIAFDDGALTTFELPPGFTDTYAPVATNSMQMNILTSLASQAPHAGAMHPAVQTLAANIQRSAGANGTTEFRLQLDPPELGRVEVQMSFGSDKTLKTGIVVEKPETFMMLQRDAQMLERTLNELGLDSEGLSLELAEQGFDFDSDNNRGGGHDKGGTGAGDDSEELEIIDTTMTWHVDPETGHTRYDIWA